MLDQSVLDWMESLGENAEEVIGRLRAEAEVDLTLKILMLEVKEAEHLARGRV